MAELKIHATIYMKELIVRDFQSQRTIGYQHNFYQLSPREMIILKIYSLTRFLYA